MELQVPRWDQRGSAEISDMSSLTSGLQSGVTDSDEMGLTWTLDIISVTFVFFISGIVIFTTLFWWTMRPCKKEGTQVQPLCLAKSLHEPAMTNHNNHGIDEKLIVKNDVYSCMYGHISPWLIFICVTQWFLWRCRPLVAAFNVWSHISLVIF